MPMIDLADINYDQKYYPRANGNSDWVTVHRYAEALRSDPEKEFPPITVVRATGFKFKYLIIDGLHRLRAYHQAGRQQILANVERLPRSRWFARSVELNVSHGRPLDTGDKAYIATQLQQDGMPMASIASLLQMQVESLERIVAERVVKMTGNVHLAVPGGRGNREINGEHYGFLKSPFTDAASATAALAVQGPVSAMDAAHVLDSAIAVLECGVDRTDEETADRLARLHALTAPEDDD